VIGLAYESGQRAFSRSMVALICSVLGWTGLIGGAVVLGFGGEWTADVMPVPVALGMAAAGALVVAPLAGDREEVAPLAVSASVAVALIVGGGAVWLARASGAAPWGDGALLLGAHWALLASAAASALTGASVAVRGLFRASREEPSPARGLRGHARDAAVRAVVLLWMAWSAGALVHRQFIGSTSLGSRSEWFAIGVTLLAAGGLLVGWEIDEEGFARLRSQLAPIWVAVVVLVGIWLSFGFGSPFGLSLGS
jgi:hypothetical protein